MPGAWTSCSMRICGAKYAACGPKTASGRPLEDSAGGDDERVGHAHRAQVGGQDRRRAAAAVARDARGAARAARRRRSSGAASRRRRSPSRRGRAASAASGRGSARDALHRRRRVGVLVGGPLAPQPLAAARAVARAERAAQLHLGQLVAAALAEDPADERRRGDDVGDLPRLRPAGPADRRVLAGHLRDVQPRLGDVLVDAGDVARRVLLQSCRPPRRRGRRAGRPGAARSASV